MKRHIERGILLGLMVLALTLSAGMGANATEPFLGGKTVGDASEYRNIMTLDGYIGALGDVRERGKEAAIGPFLGGRLVEGDGEYHNIMTLDRYLWALEDPIERGDYEFRNVMTLEGYLAAIRDPVRERDRGIGLVPRQAEEVTSYEVTPFLGGRLVEGDGEYRNIMTLERYIWALEDPIEREGFEYRNIMSLENYLAALKDPFEERVGLDAAVGRETVSHDRPFLSGELTIKDGYRNFITLERYVEALEDPVERAGEEYRNVMTCERFVASLTDPLEEEPRAEDTLHSYTSTLVSGSCTEEIKDLLGA